MDFKSHLTEIRNFLTPYSDIWNKEILTYYPDVLSAYSNNFLELLDPLDTEQLWEIDARVDFSQIEGTQLHELLKKTISFNKIIKSHTKTKLDLPPVAFTRVKEKKRHELDNLIPLITDLKEKRNFKNVIDIGGGVGHLSRILGQYCDIPSTCIDYNAEFIARGKKTINRISHSKKDNIKFLEMDVKKTSIADFNKNIDLFNNDSFMIGLHSCGPLSVKLLQTAAHHNMKGILNFGCCYFKCAGEEGQTHISNFAKSNPFNISQEGLTLATRAHTYISKDNFLNKLQVKKYRYGLHLFLNEELGMKEFISVGDCSLKSYYRGFAPYAKEKLNFLNIGQNITETDLEKYFNSDQVKNTIRKMFLCNLIRWFFGRPIELYILIDRALYMQEQGYETMLTQYFEESISPRNIGLLALK